MLEHPPRLLVIGLDGASLNVLGPLLDAGRLPVLSRLLDESAYGPTETTWPAHTAPGWVTLLTACQPGGHGIYQFFDTQDPCYGARIMRSVDTGRSTVWDWLAAQGLSLGLVNVPMSHPPADLPGYQVTWPLVQTLRFCRPATVLGDLAREGATFRPDIAVMFRGDHAYLDGALTNVLDRVRSSGHLMTRHPTDVTMVVLTEPDRICHHYWHFADQEHPSHESPAVPRWSDAIGLVYEAVDRAVGALLDLVGPQTPVLVVSDHGSGPGFRSLALNRLLAEAGFLATTRSPAAGQADWFRGREVSVDFERTRAYCPVPGSYGVNVNQAGRQRDGTVRDPGTLLDEISDLLLGLRTPDGEPVFRSVLPAEAAYPGPFSALAPDLQLIPADEATMVTPDVDGPLWGASAQTGLHRHEGMWSYRAPGVVPGPRRALPLVNVMPTVLTHLDLAWPAGVHGAAASDVLGPAARPRRLPDDAGSPRRDPGPVVDSSTGDALRAMGYL